MNLLTGNIKTLYLKYLAAAFGSAIIVSIYSIADMAIVGQYQGPEGTAALAVIAPIWNIIYSVGLLMGIGGSIIFSTLKGQTSQKQEDENEFFTTALIGAIILSIICWVIILLFEKQILFFFGADNNLLPLTQQYLIPIKFVIPLFLFNQMLAAFLRSDNNPFLATIAILAGGIFNIIGDYIFVFPMNMGIFGAGLATAIGSLISFLIMLVHFRTKKNTIKLSFPINFLNKLKSIIVAGFSTFFVDIAMGILTILFNRQIMTYLGSDALAIYGVIINISTFVQCCAYSVGQGSQPIISTNFGAKYKNRINKTLRYALCSVGLIGIFWLFVSLIYPNLYIYIFMKPTSEILAIAPGIIRGYALSFLLLPLNVFSTYYFQAILQPKSAFIVSMARGLIISGALIIILPMFVNVNSIWYAMFITETLVALYVIKKIKEYSK